MVNFNAYGTAQNLLKDVKNGLQGEDVREGLTAVISIKLVGRVQTYRHCTYDDVTTQSELRSDLGPLRAEQNSSSWSRPARSQRW
jgi:hypothetical protein